MSGGKTIALEDACHVEYGTRVVQKRDGGSIYPVYGGGGATFKLDAFNRQDRLVIARFGMSKECTRFVAGKFFLNDSGLTVSPRRGNVCQRFLDYQMLSKNDEIFALGKGSAQKNLDVAAFRALPILVLEDVAEQQRIVGILDAAFAGIAIAKINVEKNRENALSLLDSYLQSIFSKRGQGWSDKRLGDVLRTGAGGTPLKSKKEYYEGGTIPWVMSGEVSQGEIRFATKFITPEGLENSSARMFPKNTVLIAMYGATAGEVGILRFEASTNQAVCGILPSDEFCPEFVFYLLLAKKCELVGQATGNAQPNISQIKIKNTVIPVVPLAAQKMIVKAVDSLREETQRLESLYQRKLIALDALKQSLLHQAFSGQL